jgi:putative tryptophan/tyrosine transport system substrate-binding protein
MRRLGFIEGQNLTVDYRAYAQHIDKLSEWAAELKQSTRRCHNNCRGFGHSRRPGGDKNHSYPYDHRRYGRIGLVNSMARPNGNTTGVSILATELDDIESRAAQRSRRPSTWRRHPALQR